MNFISERAEKIASQLYDSGYASSRFDVIEKLENELSPIHSKQDKITIITTFLEVNEREKIEHQKRCHSKLCDNDATSDEITYYLNQELLKYGVSLNGDVFSTDEKRNLENKIDELAVQMETLLQGQKIILDALISELEELKQYLYTGKKTWGQLLLGKITEMVAGGVISDSIGHSITDSLKPFTQLLIQ